MFQNTGLISEQVNTLRGKINAFKEPGLLLVEISDRDQPIPCSFVTMNKNDVPNFEIGDEVLVILDSSENSGYILGFINAQFTFGKTDPNPVQQNQLEIALPQKPKDLNVNGKRITIEADDEIQLKCGKSSFLMSRDGKVIIRGTYLVSRSSGINKIKGASVAIN